MPSTRVPWWVRPCAGGDLYPDRDTAELFGPARFCPECAAWHARTEDPAAAALPRAGIPERALDPARHRNKRQCAGCRMWWDAGAVVPRFEPFAGGGGRVAYRCPTCATAEAPPGATDPESDAPPF
jgi:hypothetical protein